ncbi:MAG: endonuclease V [Methanolinea sp.]|jgi:deoxyribonuclease V|nr:endonuclease V [Methanolinea sp.]
MEPFHLPSSLEEAEEIQIELLRALERESQVFCGDPSLVAGMDVSYGGESACACVVVVTYPALTPVSRCMARSPVRFPYIPGYFAFREIPALLHAFSLVAPLPDLLLVHGHGYAHPRRVGLATHLGAILQIPSLGVAGRGSLGMQASEPGTYRGATSPILLEGEVVGVLLRTREGNPPVYVSAGYRTTLVQAREYTLRCCRNSRFPEPIVRADRAARRMRRWCAG